MEIFESINNVFRTLQFVGLGWLVAVVFAIVLSMLGVIIFQARVIARQRKTIKAQAARIAELEGRTLGGWFHRMVQGVATSIRDISRSLASGFNGLLGRVSARADNYQSFYANQRGKFSSRTWEGFSPRDRSKTKHANQRVHKTSRPDSSSRSEWDEFFS